MKIKHFLHPNKTKIIVFIIVLLIIPGLTFSSGSICVPHSDYEGDCGSGLKLKPFGLFLSSVSIISDTHELISNAPDPEMRAAGLGTYDPRTKMFVIINFLSIIFTAIISYLLACIIYTIKYRKKSSK